jgi:hypothetical protein
MKVIIACEESGTVKLAFLQRGIEAWSCDLQDSDMPMNHIVADIRTVDLSKFDLMICHPPCTYLAGSGVQHMSDPKRLPKRIEAVQFAEFLWNAPVRHIALENPVGCLPHWLGPATQSINPWEFGHPEQKRTMLWLKNLPALRETNNVYDHMMTLPRNQRERLFFLPPSADRAKLRSKTFQGIADAMAQQWGDYVLAQRTE